MENFKATVSLHFAHHNFVWPHKSLRVTRAVAADVSDRLQTLQEVAEETSRPTKRLARWTGEGFFLGGFLGAIVGAGLLAIAGWPKFVQRFRQK
jgi:hypothetical protein